MAHVAVVATVLALATAGGGARAPLSNESAAPKLAAELAGVKLGSTRKALEKRFPGLYRHRLAMGEVLYEACDQKRLVVFTFTAAPWSPEFITDIEMRREDDVGVCRDATGALPDLGFAPTTPKGVAIGDPAPNVLALYGKPNEEKTLPNGDRILRYRSSGKGYAPPIRNILLVVWLREGKVRSFTQTGDIPGVKTPFMTD
jgi:hypothetical protein